MPTPELPARPPAVSPALPLHPPFHLTLRAPLRLPLWAQAVAPARRRPGRWLLVLASLGLGACSQLPVGVTPAPAVDAAPPPASAAALPVAPVPVVVEARPISLPQVDPTDQASRRLLAYHERLRQMPPAELQRELARLAEVSGPAATLELALALGQTRNTNDTQRALGLLDPLVRSNAPELAPWQPLARLLSSRLAEQRRLEDQLERQNQQLRENTRRIEQLNGQLEALKAIERSLTPRPELPASGVPPAQRRSVRP